MNLQEVKDIIVSDYTFLHEVGFAVDDSSKGLGFIRPTEQGKEFISFAILNYGHKHHVRVPIGSKRFNKVEDILFEVLHLPDEDKDTSTIYPLGEYDGKMDDVLPGPLDYVQNEDDVRKVIDIMKTYIKEYILPFFTKYPTLKEVDAKVRQIPIVELHKFIGQEVIGRRMIIMKLVDNPNYEEYVEMILDYFLADGQRGKSDAKIDLEKYTKLRDYLVSIHPKL